MIDVRRRPEGIVHGNGQWMVVDYRLIAGGEGNAMVAWRGRESCLSRKVGLGLLLRDGALETVCAQWTMSGGIIRGLVLLPVLALWHELLLGKLSGGLAVPELLFVSGSVSSFQHFQKNVTAQGNVLCEEYGLCRLGACAVSCVCLFPLGWPDGRGARDKRFSCSRAFFGLSLRGRYGILLCGSSEHKRSVPRFRGAHRVANERFDHVRQRF